MEAPLSITLAQLNPTLGDLKGNAEKVLEVWRDSKSDLVVFSEMILCGYPPEDLVLKPAFIDAIHAQVENICAASKAFKAGALISCPWRVNGEIYNAVHLIENGKIIHTQAKHHLPNYGVFDEQRIFKAGAFPNAVSFRGYKIGILICEDMWHSDVAAHLKSDGAEILIVPNGSPFESTKDDTRAELAKLRVKETELPLVYVNQTGGQDELVFDGGSFVMCDHGDVLFQAPQFTEGVFSVTLSQDRDLWTTAGIQSAPALSDDEELYQALVLGLKDYVDKNGFPGVLIGLSGGIDSALAAVLAVDALGKDRVHCVMMPSPYTSQASLDDAAALASNLGCTYDVLSIEPAMQAFSDTIPHLDGVAHENMQSRSRGLILMALSNSSGKMVLSTGNKSEMAVGYATLYGDMCGGFNALKDLYKMQVYKLSEWRNSKRPETALGPSGTVIPKNIITKAPTAELKDNQKDQDSLPEYEVLDDILECLIEYEMHVSKIVERGHDEETVRRVWKMLDRAEYKRRQAPPGVKVTARAFGRDRRYPITNKFRG